MKFFEAVGQINQDETTTANSKSYQELVKSDFAKRLEEHALKFEMSGGLVKSISPSTKSVQSDVLNVQRGVLSMFQVRKVSEEDPEKLSKAEVKLLVDGFPFQHITS